MNTQSLIPRLVLALGLFAAVQVVPIYAITAKEFLALPERQQADTITSTVNYLCEKLRSEYNTKGEHKSPESLAKQKKLARFTIELFDERDSSGTPTAYVKLDSLIYYASLDEKDAKLSLESLILSFAVKQYNEHQATDATKSEKVTAATPQQAGKS